MVLFPVAASPSMNTKCSGPFFPFSSFPASATFDGKVEEGEGEGNDEAEDEESLLAKGSADSMKRPAPFFVLALREDDNPREILHPRLPPRLIIVSIAQPRSPWSRPDDTEGPTNAPSTSRITAPFVLLILKIPLFTSWKWFISFSSRRGTVKKGRRNSR
jgi:hypothetical protein